MSDNLISAIEYYLKNNKDSKIKTAQMLINYKIFIHQLNIKINESLTNRRFRTATKYAKQLIFYISTWGIYIDSGVIDRKIIKTKLGNFLIQEHKLLE